MYKLLTTVGWLHWVAPVWMDCNQNMQRNIASYLACSGQGYVDCANQQLAGCIRYPLVVAVANVYGFNTSDCHALPTEVSVGRD